MLHGLAQVCLYFWYIFVKELFIITNPVEITPHIVFNALLDIQDYHNVIMYAVKTPVSLLDI